MKYKLIIPLVVSLFVLVTITSCKKNFLDINDDPNRVTENNITAELIFPQAASSVGARAAAGGSNDYFRILNQWVGYWSVAGDYAIDQTQSTYNIDNNFGNLIWFNHYNTLFDLYQVKVKSMANRDSVLAGASMILSVKLWQELVDMFGDIPYSQAFNNDAYNLPAYDNAKDVYSSLLKSLDTAITNMSKTARKNFAKVDVVNNGNTLKWIKFANTLRLRLLIRQSQVSGFNPATEIAKIIATGGVLHSGESVSVNPGYTNSVNQQSPFYGNYGLNTTGTDPNPSVRANAYMVSIFNANSDPRLSRFYAPPTAGGAITGTVYGLAAGNPDGQHSSKAGPGLAISSSQSQWIYPSFESMFLEAEAIARGWMPGDAKIAYEAAVTESFVWLGVPNASTAAANYLLANPSANWANSGTTVLQKAKFIAYQKYIALTEIDPLEAWSDIRRLDMIPNKGYISVNPARAAGNTLPTRLLYPQTEYTTNAEHTLGLGTINAFTSKIFWQQ
ncbi:MAG: SusD/RagB family nutrient-binding outer rane lipoprotein [Chitinophagaceae bacterium]|nr:SusD/RagB family nutrient-binding outer rane lipoprotein [Chitinophagaceae bacterium]